MTEVFDWNPCAGPQCHPVPPGTYTITANVSGYVSAPTPFTVAG